MRDKVISIPKGTLGMSWFFEQSIYYPYGIARALKSSEGSGNVPKVILIEEND